MSGLIPLKLVHRTLLRRGCDHSIPPSLRTRLSDSKSCPQCQINKHIKEIREVQQGVEMRGGIFVSKERVHAENRARAADICVPGQQAKRHKAWLRKWISTKVNVTALLVEFEEVLKEMREAKELNGIEEVEKAIELWRQVEDEMTVVPGSYEEFAMKKFEDDGTEDEGTIPPYAEDASKNLKTQDSQSDSKEPLVAAAPGQGIQIRQSNLPTTSTLRSALRRTHTSMPLASSRVHITPTATYVTRPSSPPLEHPNRPHREASANRNALTFQRGSKLYRTGTWTSPEGCEKLDTSLMTVGWEDLEGGGEVEEGLQARHWLWVLNYWVKKSGKAWLKSWDGGVLPGL